MEVETADQTRDVERGPRPDRAPWLIGAVVLVFVLVAVGAARGGLLAEATQDGWLLGPFLILGALHQLRERWRGARLLAWGWYWAVLLAGAIVLFGLLSTALVGGPAPGAALGPATSRNVFLTLIVLLAGVWVVAGLVSSRGWLAVARLLGARVSAGSMADAQAVGALLYFVYAAVASLVILGGHALLLVLIQLPGAQQSLNEMGTGQLRGLVWEVVWTVPTAMVLAGFPLRRSLPEAFHRLGVRRLAWRVLPILLIAALALIALGFVLDAAMEPILRLLGWPATNAELVKRLFGDTTTSVQGAVLVGITAGISEEVLTRGLLQPRLGWLLPNLAFAAAHAFQYGPDGVVSIFVLGAVQAYLRNRWNTTASMTTHGLYDTLVVLGSVLHLPGF